MSNGGEWSFPPLKEHKSVGAATAEVIAEATGESDAQPVTEPGAPRFIDRLDSQSRKQFPMATGFIDYFPDAMAAVSHIAWLGNEKHNPGQPLHHARGKSTDHPDCVVRHLSTRHDSDPAYHDDVLAPVFHLAEAAWRAMALLQETMEKEYGLALAPAAVEG